MTDRELQLAAALLEAADEFRRMRLAFSDYDRRERCVDLYRQYTAIARGADDWDELMSQKS